MGKTFNMEVSIDTKLFISDPSNLKTVLSGIFNEKVIKESIHTNICNFCSPFLTRAARKYINNYIIPKITKHPNIDYTKPESVDYRGALGVPSRLKYKRLRAFLKKSYQLKVTACPNESGTTLSFIKYKVKEIAEQAYKVSTFRTGNNKGTGSPFRDWLREADTGEPKLENFHVLSLAEAGNTSSGRKPYSRTGTHVMVEGGSYDPDDWRPLPQEKHIIENVFLTKLPLIQKAILRAMPQCIRRIKKQLLDAILRRAKSQQGKAKTVGGEVVAQQADSRSSQGAEGVESADFVKAVSSASYEGQLKAIADETGKDISTVRAQIIQQSKLFGKSPEAYLGALINQVFRR